jgi:L-alanine-DL-glutamate epimerase-like enolase superfamily enzyme
MFSLDRPYADREAVVGAISTVDTALWDLKGRITRQPLWKMLGGYRRKVPIIGIGGYYENARDERGIRDEIAHWKNSGLAGIKFKVGRIDIEEDAERVKIARDAAGPEFVIVIDSNRAWSPHDSVRFAEMVAGVRPAWLEEPVHTHTVRGLREVRMKSGLRIAAGQSEISVFDCFPLLAEEAVDIINLQYNCSGGVSAWQKMAHAAALADISVAQVGEPHVSMHLIGAFPNTTFVECYPDEARDPFWHNLYRDRPVITNGTILLPDEPGLGVTLNSDAVEQYAVEPWA